MNGRVNMEHTCKQLNDVQVKMETMNHRRGNRGRSMQTINPLTNKHVGNKVDSHNLFWECY